MILKQDLVLNKSYIYLTHPGLPWHGHHLLLNFLHFCLMVTELKKDAGNSEKGMFQGEPGSAFRYMQPRTAKLTSGVKFAYLSTTCKVSKRNHLNHKTVS